MAHDLLPLELLRRGEWADIAELHGEPGFIGRLTELGLGIGCRLCVLQPGSPCLIQVGETRLSLRADWAMQILVRPLL